MKVGLTLQTLHTCKWQTRSPELPLVHWRWNSKPWNLKQALWLLIDARGKGKICTKPHLEFHLYFTNWGLLLQPVFQMSNLLRVNNFERGTEERTPVCILVNPQGG